MNFALDSARWAASVLPLTRLATRRTRESHLRRHLTPRWAGYDLDAINGPAFWLPFWSAGR